MLIMVLKTMWENKEQCLLHIDVLFPLGVFESFYIQYYGGYIYENYVWCNFFFMT